MTSAIDRADAILDRARKLVAGARQHDYGPPEVNFADIAVGWEVIFRKGITPSTVALAMCWLKICRTRTSPEKDDHYVDICGYGALAGALAVPPELDEEPGL